MTRSTHLLWQSVTALVWSLAFAQLHMPMLTIMAGVFGLTKLVVSFHYYCQEVDESD